MILFYRIRKNLPLDELLDLVVIHKFSIFDISSGEILLSNPFGDREVCKKTNLEKYGVENVFQNKDIRNKIEETNIKKYGFKNPFQSEEIKNKIKSTNLKKYGVEYITQSKEYKDKSFNTNVNNGRWIRKEDRIEF